MDVSYNLLIVYVDQNQKGHLKLKTKLLLQKVCILRIQIEKYFYSKTANKPCDLIFLNYFNLDV